ncbi:restriction endonuclease [Desulfurispirillum indicum]|uniref:restriction endonuclease n=1 Tax=Desulfurispirillum indicum TaxID=936456 RepID=UPI001CFA8737|nr:restriction endonuclease [Desulfurispirillum indicum]UCZ55494.1 restriction endonuclease [Desulfurispirillum indicum]
MVKRVTSDSLIMMSEGEFEFLISRLLRHVGFSINESLDFGNNERIYIAQGRKKPYMGKFVIRYKRNTGEDDILDMEFLNGTSHWTIREATNKVLIVSNCNFSEELQFHADNSEVELIGADEIVRLANEIAEEDERRKKEQESIKKRRKRPNVPYGRTLILKLETEYTIDLAPVTVKEWLNVWLRIKSEIEVILATALKIDPESVDKNDSERLKSLTTKLEGLYFDLMKYKVPDVAQLSRDMAERVLENVILLVTGTLYEEPLEDIEDYRANITKLDNELTAVNKELVEYLEEKEKEVKRREKFRNIVLVGYVVGILLLMAILVSKT